MKFTLLDILVWTPTLTGKAVMIFLGDDLAYLVFFQDRVTKGALNGVDFDGRGFWSGAVDEDGFEDAVV